MQRRDPVLVRLREQKYILILNWNKENNTITYKDGKYYVDYTSSPKTSAIKIHHNLVIVGNKSFNRRYLKQVGHVNKISKK